MPMPALDRAIARQHAPFSARLNYAISDTTDAISTRLNSQFGHANQARSRIREMLRSEIFVDNIYAVY